MKSSVLESYSYLFPQFSLYLQFLYWSQFYIFEIVKSKAPVSQLVNADDT